MIDQLIEKWETKHHVILDTYSKGNANKEVMQLYRTQMKDILEVIQDLKQLSTLTDIDRTIIDKLRNEGLFYAVKYCKEHTCKGLKEAKEYCEQLKAVHQVVTIIKD